MLPLTRSVHWAITYLLRTYCSLRPWSYESNQTAKNVPAPVPMASSLRTDRPHTEQQTPQHREVPSYKARQKGGRRGQRHSRDVSSVLGEAS